MDDARDGMIYMIILYVENIMGNKKNMKII